jgi:DUF1016 N-terminal domain
LSIADASVECQHFVDTSRLFAPQLYAESRVARGTSDPGKVRIVLEWEPRMDTNKHKWDFEKLVVSIRQVHEELAAQAGRAVNIGLTMRNWFIGAYIAEFELRGSDRASYGDSLLSDLSRELRSHKISNTGRRQLYNYLSFYHAYPQIVRTVPAQSRHLLPKTIASGVSPREPAHRPDARCYPGRLALDPDPVGHSRCGLEGLRQGEMVVVHRHPAEGGCGHRGPRGLVRVVGVW